VHWQNTDGLINLFYCSIEFFRCFYRLDFKRSRFRTKETWYSSSFFIRKTRSIFATCKFKTGWPRVFIWLYWNVHWKEDEKL